MNVSRLLWRYFVVKRKQREIRTHGSPNLQSRNDLGAESGEAKQGYAKGFYRRSALTQRTTKQGKYKFGGKE